MFFVICNLKLLLWFKKNFLITYRSPRLTKWDPVSQGEGRELDIKEEEGGIIKREKGEFGESITIYRGVEDSGPDFSDEEIEYKDVKVGSDHLFLYLCPSFPPFFSSFYFFPPILFQSLTYQDRENDFSLSIFIFLVLSFSLFLYIQYIYIFISLVIFVVLSPLSLT